MQPNRWGQRVPFVPALSCKILSRRVGEAAEAKEVYFELREFEVRVV